jgi:AraC-like DNA-binding protein
VEFRNRLRIEIGNELLVNPNPSVSEIAYAVGFESLTQFNRLFRRIAGQSPTAYRRSIAVRNGIAPSSTPGMRLNSLARAVPQNWAANRDCQMRVPTWSY